MQIETPMERDLKFIKEMTPKVLEGCVKFVLRLLIAIGLIGFIAQITKQPEAKAENVVAVEKEEETRDTNISNEKPTEYWRLNSNGYTQRYVPLT